jgi:archaellum component FlaC
MDSCESPPSATGLTAERDALRIQAAAVAAQQAQLTDQEAQLNQRRDALEQREQQIAAHLEERHHHLLELREEIKQERAVFDEKKTAQQSELVKARKQAERARRRFVEARKRFKQRWLRYTAEKQTSLHQREQLLLAGQEQLHKDVEAHQRERAHFNEIRLRLNGEIEVGRRELKEAWQELGLAQQRWDEALNVEHRGREQRLRALEAREHAVVDARRKLVADIKHWQNTCTRLHEEIEGLDTRARNLRHQVNELQGPARPAAVVAVAAAVPDSAAHPDAAQAWIHDSPAVPVVVQRVASQLADQRWLLLEHWSRFLQIEESWQQDRATLVAEAEETERRLRQRETNLDARERSLEEHEAELRRRQELLARTRAELDTWQTRLALVQANGESERAAHLGLVEVREQTATALVRQLEAVRQRRQARRCKEIEALRQARAQCNTVRQEYVALLRRFQERQVALAEDQRALAAGAMAVERCRLELLHQAPDAAATEKRLEKHRRRNSARIEAAERKVTAQRQWLLAESRRLEDQARQLQKREDELAALQEKLTQQQTEWEQEQIAHAQNELPRERELRLLKTQHENDTRQLAALRDEVERIARLLLDDSAPVTANQAA